MLNVQLESCAVMKGKDKRIEKRVLRWFGYIERKGNDRTAKRVYVGVYVAARSVAIKRGGLIP